MSDFLSDAEFEQFRKLIYEESGIHFSATNRSILESRIKEQLRANNLEHVQDYFAKVSKTRKNLRIS